MDALMAENKDKFDGFREKYPVFTYKDYSWKLEKNILTLSFTYVLSEEDTIKTSIEINLPGKISEENIKENEDFIFRIGLIEALSYWKAYCSPKILIECGALSEYEISWWQKTWYDGMGEFRYKNGLLSVSKEDWVILEARPPKFGGLASKISKLHGNMIGFTGGKDSTLALALLREEKENETFGILPVHNMEKIKSILGAEKSPETLITRTMNERLITLNHEGALNGHTPFSIVVAFIGMFLASLRGKKYVIVSNESSANEPTVPDTDINHQYSKSLAFEKRFQDYTNQIWPDGPKYFSLLRPFSEAGIVKMLKKYEEVMPYISSCNKKIKKGLWCGHCSKCLFAFTMISAVWDIPFAQKIFGIDMFEMPEHMNMLLELTGLAPTKPFECVGTMDESISALSKIFASDAGAKNKALLSGLYNLHEDALPDPKRFDEIACQFREHLMPENFAEIARKAQNQICHESR